jgi:hypothetical protein
MMKFLFILYQSKKKKFSEPLKDEKKDELLLNIIVPKEIFQSETGELMV